MATKPISSPLPANLPENWATGQTVAPTGAEVGLGENYGYNYLMEQVNAAQQAVNTMNNAFEDLATTEDLAEQTASDVGYTNNEQTTVSGALDALFQGLADGTITSVTATATAAGWSGDIPVQTISVAGMTADSIAWVGLPETATAQQRDAARKAVMSPTAQGVGTITLTCDGAKPAIDIPIIVYLSGGAN